jgi:hypothetical protein
LDKIFVKAIMLVLILTSNAYGQYRPPVSSGPYRPPGTTPGSIQTPTAVVPNSMEVNNQYYPGTVSGLRDYMNDLKNSQPETHLKLSKDFDDLYSKQVTANWVFWSSIAVGSVAVIGGFTFLATKETKTYSAASGLAPETVTTPNYGAVYGGLGLMAIGSVVSLVLAPGREDILTFINKHNRINNQFPIKWQLGWDVSKKTPGILLSYNF